jgi:hypothetical protein
MLAVLAEPPIQSVPPWTRGTQGFASILSHNHPLSPTVKHFDISKPEKINAERFDEFLTILVSHRRSAGNDCSIDLNGKSEFGTIEVNKHPHCIVCETCSPAVAVAATSTTEPIQR